MPNTDLLQQEREKNDCKLKDSKSWPGEKTGLSDSGRRLSRKHILSLQGECGFLTELKRFSCVSNFSGVWLNFLILENKELNHKFCGKFLFY